MTQQQQRQQQLHEHSKMIFPKFLRILHILHETSISIVISSSLVTLKLFLKNVNIRCCTVAMTRARPRRLCVGNCAVVVRGLLSTPHDFSESFTEVLREKGVQEGIETRVQIRQTLAQYLDGDGERRCVVKFQWFQHQDDLDRCPANCEGDHLWWENWT